MTEVVFLGLGLVIGAAVAWFLGVKRGGREMNLQLASLIRGLEAGNLPDPQRTSKKETPEVQELRRLLAREWTHVGPDREDQIRKALLKIAVYLRHRVEAPLLAGLEGGSNGLREGADAALAGVEDLEFFLEDPRAAQDPAPENLTEVVQEVIHEFAGQSPVLVKIRSPMEPVRVRIEAEPIKDAIFLVLHNAGEFGGGDPVEVFVETRDDLALLRVRDRGPGFSAEALLQAMDPFYSTSPGGLGLGLPHARRAVNGQGGEIFLRNQEEGGAEVEIQLPLAG